MEEKKDSTKSDDFIFRFGQHFRLGKKDCRGICRRQRIVRGKSIKAWMEGKESKPGAYICLFISRAACMANRFMHARRSSSGEFGQIIVRQHIIHVHQTHSVSECKQHHGITPDFGCKGTVSAVPQK